MADMEKVINCLEDIENIMIARQDICPPEELQYWVELQEGVADAIAILKEQEAVKPKSKVRHGANAQIQHFCGNCNAMLHGKPKFCSNCGRGVLW